MILNYRVHEQTLEAIPTNSTPRDYSREYLTLHFDFTEDWSQYTKTAFLEYQGYEPTAITIGDDGLVHVPTFYVQNDHFLVYVVGTYGVNETCPTNVLSVTLAASGDRWTTLAPDPESIPYQQLVALAAGAVKYDREQELTDGEKAQARDNIDAQNKLTAGTGINISESGEISISGTEPAVAPAIPIATAYPRAALIDVYDATGSDLPTVRATDHEQGITHIGKGRQIVFIPTRKNLTVAPKLAINGGEAIEIRLRATENQGEDDDVPDATTPVSVGMLMRGVPYTMTFCGLYWLVDSLAGQGGSDVDNQAVHYYEEEKSQKSQAIARGNIGAEAAENKVTSISASSTDAQYPSAKAVYDGLAEKIDEDDVLEIDVIQAAEAVANANNNNAVLTPAAAKALVLEYGGDAHNIKVFNLDDITTAQLYALYENDPKTAVFLAYNAGNYEPETGVYPYQSKLLLLPLNGIELGTAVTAVFEQDTNLVTYTEDTPPVAVSVRKTVRVTVQSGAQAGDPDVKTVEIVPTELDRICPEPIVLTPSSNFQYSAEAWSKTKNYTAGDYFYNNQNGSAGVIGIPHIYVCVNSFTGDGTPLSTRISAGDVNDLGEMLSLPSGLSSMTQYAASISRGTLKILFGNVLIHQFHIAAGIVSCNGLMAGVSRTLSFSYDTSTGAISKINYATAVL